MEEEAARVIVVHDGKVLLMHRNKFGREYYTLIGGHIDPGEDPLTAMLREVDEETGLKLANPRLVYEQAAIGQYNKQYIFTADYVSGDITLSEDVDEAKANKLGKNTYEPLWMPLEQLDGLPFLPPELRDHIVQDLAHGFPDEPVMITPKGVK